MHFAYWPPQLNVKVLPKDIKQQITQKYENEFYPWIEDNWESFTGVKEAGIDKETFMSANYGIKRYKGIINFMNAECSIQKEILALEVLKKRLLAENEILWDEVNAVNRDLVSLKRIFEKNKETS